MSLKAREGFANSMCVVRKLRMVHTDCHVANRAEILEDGYLGTMELSLLSEFDVWKEIDASHGCLGNWREQEYRKQRQTCVLHKRTGQS